MTITRGLLVVALLFPAAALPCSPGEFEPFTLESKGPRKLKLEVTGERALLSDAKGKVWSLDVPGRRAQLSPDEAWVVFDSALGEPLITIVPTVAAARPRDVNVLAQLNEDEQSQIPQTSCGPMWNEGLKATAAGVEVSVSQNSQRRPTQEVLPGLKFLVKPDGTVQRLTPARVIDLAAVAKKWETAKGEWREDALMELVELAQRPTGAAQAEKLGPFISKVLAAPEASERELELAAALVGSLPASEVEAQARAVLKKGKGERGLFYSLGRKHQALAWKLADEVFADAKRSAAARADAARTACAYGARGWVTTCDDALSSQDDAIREVAADAAGRLNDCQAKDAERFVQAIGAEKSLRAQESLAHAVRNCGRTWGGKPDHRTPALYAAIKKGQKFPDSLGAESFGSVAVYATAKKDDAVAKAELKHAREVLERLKYRDDEGRQLLDVWEILLALARKDEKDATRRFEALLALREKERLSGAMVCSLDASWVGKATSLRDCGNVGIYDFIENAKVRLKPAAKKK
jgi:hypothetical protein